MLISNSSTRAFRSLVASICLLAVLFALCACQEDVDNDTEVTDTVGYYDAETLASICYGYVVKTEDRYFFVAADNSMDGHILGKGDFAQMKQPLPPDEVDLDVLNTGDYISIKVYTVQTSYPLQAGIHDLQVISHGSLSDVPSEQVEKIKALGYTIIE